MLTGTAGAAHRDDMSSLPHRVTVVVVVARPLSWLSRVMRTLRFWCAQWGASSMRANGLLPPGDGAVSTPSDQPVRGDEGRGGRDDG